MGGACDIGRYGGSFLRSLAENENCWVDSGRGRRGKRGREREKREEEENEEEDKRRSGKKRKKRKKRKKKQKKKKTKRKEKKRGRATWVVTAREDGRMRECMAPLQL